MSWLSNLLQWCCGPDDESKEKALEFEIDRDEADAVVADEVIDVLNSVDATFPKFFLRKFCKNFIELIVFLRKYFPQENLRREK